MPAEHPLAALDRIETSIKHYNLNGEVISFREWVELAEDPHYHTQAHDYVRSDRGMVRVSTIWLGLDHRFWPLDGSAPPIIFETMTFCADSDEYDRQQWRFCHLQEALSAHRQITETLGQSWWLNLGGRAW